MTIQGNEILEIISIEFITNYYGTLKIISTGKYHYWGINDWNDTEGLPSTLQLISEDLYKQLKEQNKINETNF